MVSNVRELFRRGLRDETFGLEMGVFSMLVKVEAIAPGLFLTSPACGERSDSRDSANPGEGDSPHTLISQRSREEPLTPALSPQERGEGANSARSTESALVAGGREQISAASDGADHRGLGRVRFDLAADSHDPQIDGAVEGLAVARVGQFQQALAREHPLRIGRENLEQAEFGSGQRMFIALVVAQRLRLEIEPFRSEPHQLVFRRLRSRGFRRCRVRPDRRTAPQYRANPRHQFTQFTGLCDVIVGAEFQPDDAVDWACGGRQHDDRDIGAAFQIADDGKPVLLRHIQIEYHQIGHAGFDRVAQAPAAIAKRHGKTVHLEILADHLARRRLVVDNDDVGALGHDISVAGKMTVKVVPCPGPWLFAVTWPPCMSMMRLTIESPRPVELSPAVGFADSRWKRPNNRPRSSGDMPAPSSAMRMMVVFCSCVTTTVILPPIGLYLMALLTRLSIASRIRSASHIVTKFGGADTVMVCCLFTAKGWLASSTSLTRPAISTGSRRMVMSKASAIASEIR